MKRCQFRTFLSSLLGIYLLPELLQSSQQPLATIVLTMTVDDVGTLEHHTSIRNHDESLILKSIFKIMTICFVIDKSAYDET